MRRIRKGTEPPSLTTYREANVAPLDWDRYLGKEEARQVATTEQRQLCAFCQTSIAYKKRPMKLAHVVPQSDPTDGQRLALTWTNIVGSCPGGEDTNRPRLLHCDSLQGSRRLSPSLDPVQFVNGSLSYDAEGRVSISADEVQREINEILGLNTTELQRNRKAALQGLKEQLATLPDRASKDQYQQNLLAELDPDQSDHEPLRQYADFLLWHLRYGDLVGSA